MIDSWALFSIELIRRVCGITAAQTDILANFYTVEGSVDALSILIYSQWVCYRAFYSSFQWDTYVYMLHTVCVI